MPILLVIHFVTWGKLLHILDPGFPHECMYHGQMYHVLCSILWGELAHPNTQSLWLRWDWHLSQNLESDKGNPKLANLNSISMATFAFQWLTMTQMRPIESILKVFLIFWKDKSSSCWDFQRGRILGYCQ